MFFTYNRGNYWDSSLGATFYSGTGNRICLIVFLWHAAVGACCVLQEGLNSVNVCTTAGFTGFLNLGVSAIYLENVVLK